MFAKVTDKQISNMLDYIIAYSCVGMVLWFTIGWENIIPWFVTAIILHFCLSSRLYFELKMRRKKAIKKFYSNRS